MNIPTYEDYTGAVAFIELMGIKAPLSLFGTAVINV